MVGSTGALRVGIRIPPCAPAPVVAAAVARAEAWGFDTASFPDSQLIWRDTFAAMAFAAVGTERIGLLSGVTNVVTRHPSLVASAARTVAELAPGRVRLGLGAGWSAAAMAGTTPSRTGELREAVAALRHLLAGDEHDFGKGPVHLHDAPGAGQVGVHLSAMGERNLALAGEIADGVIIMMTTSPTLLADALGLVAKGAARAGRDMADLHTAVLTFTQVTDDAERDARLLKPACAMGLRSTPPHRRALAGIDFVAPERIPGVYPDPSHAEDWELALEACDAVVPDEVALAYAEHFALFGTPADLAARLRIMGESGVDEVIVQPVGGDTNYTFPDALMASFAPVLELLRTT